MQHVQDLWNVIVQIFSTSDIIQLVLLIGIPIAAAFLMPAYNSILNVTFIALVVYALALYLRELFMGGQQDAGALAKADWDKFMALDVKTLIAYALSFAAIISAVFLVRSVILRR